LPSRDEDFGRTNRALAVAFDLGYCLFHSPNDFAQRLNQFRYRFGSDATGQSGVEVLLDDFEVGEERQAPGFKHNDAGPAILLIGYDAHIPPVNKVMDNPAGELAAGPGSLSEQVDPSSFTLDGEEQASLGKAHPRVAPGFQSRLNPVLQTAKAPKEEVDEVGVGPLILKEFFQLRVIC